MLNEMIMGLAASTIVLAAIAIMVFMKLKRFEADNVKNVINLFALGVAFYLVVLVLDAANYLGQLGGYVMPDISMASNIVYFLVLPLIVVFFVSAIFILKDS